MLNVTLVKSGPPGPLLATKTAKSRLPLPKVALSKPVLVAKSGLGGQVIVAKSGPGTPVKVVVSGSRMITHGVCQLGSGMCMILLQHFSTHLVSCRVCMLVVIIPFLECHFFNL